MPAAQVAQSNRMTSSGSWNPIGTNKNIFDVGNHEVPIAVKRVFVFYLGHLPLTTKTSWVMHEYCLTNPPRVAVPSSSIDPIPSEEMVLCKISNKDLPEPPILHRDILQFPPSGLYDVAYSPILDLEPLEMEYLDVDIGDIDDDVTTDDSSDLDEEDINQNTTTT
uniref:NAC domain-containing protein n=1 Tax=Leersia perrieri TaxID=77586 RepID=A0A0D9WBQ2_9ORYZ